MNALQLLKAVSIITIIRTYNLFTTVVDWREIWYLMEVSTMFYFCRYRVFTSYDRIEVFDVAIKYGGDVLWAFWDRAKYCYFFLSFFSKKWLIMYNVANAMCYFSCNRLSSISEAHNHEWERCLENNTM